MDIINPFEELVVFGKRLPLEPLSSTIIGALHPTGKHVGHGQDLGHFRGPKSGGRAGHLERYTTKVVGQRQGPFGKGLVPVAAAKNAVVATSPLLAQTAAKSAVKANPAAAVTNSNIPHAAKVGTRL